jgi:Beta-propeller repeat
VRSICLVLLGYSLVLTPISADPQLAFKDLFGGSGSSATNNIALDASGSVYVTGQGPHAPGALTTGAVLVEKWNAAGDKLIYSKTFGGSAFNMPSGIAVDANGSAYIVGYTSSADFPVTPDAFQQKLAGVRNEFVVKLSPDGSQIVYATLLGSGTEVPGGIAVDASGAAYLTGSVNPGPTDPDFPVTANAFQKNRGANCTSKLQAQYFNFPTTGDAYVAKLSPNGASLVYASYLGGSCGDNGAAISVNSDGTAWVVGTTSSVDFAVTPDALQPTHGGGFSNGFLVRVSANGDRLEYATFLGGARYDRISAMARDAQNNLYLTGSSGGFSEPGISQRVPIKRRHQLHHPRHRPPGIQSQWQSLRDEIKSAGQQRDGVDLYRQSLLLGCDLHCGGWVRRTLDCRFRIRQLSHGNTPFSANW